MPNQQQELLEIFRLLSPFNQLLVILYARLKFFTCKLFALLHAPRFAEPNTQPRK